MWVVFRTVKHQIQPIDQRATSEHDPTFQTTAHNVNKKDFRAVYTVGPTEAVSFFSPLSFSRRSLRYWRSSALAWTQYTSRVCRPPPQSPVRLPRRRSCWLSNRSMRQSLHSVVLQVNLRRRWEKRRKHEAEEEERLLFCVHVCVYVLVGVTCCQSATQLPSCAILQLCRVVTTH